MKNIFFPFILFIAISFFSTGKVQAQCDSTAHLAKKFMSADFLSDGQSYRALIYDDQVAEFNTTFYGGAKYRIVAYSGVKPEQVVFNLTDMKNNVLFTNKEYQHSPYWDFEFENTVECKVEAFLDVTKLKSGCAVILIGFEK